MKRGIFLLPGCGLLIHSLPRSMGSEVGLRGFFRRKDRDLLVSENKLLKAPNLYYHYFFNILGNLANRKILDIGCGTGHWGIFIAKYLAPGAYVNGCDIDDAAIKTARIAAKANGVQDLTQFLLMRGDQLGYKAESLDIVYGIAALHHIEKSGAQKEIYRVLKPGGRAIFCEPLGENPLLECIRKRIPYPGKCREESEHPLRYQDIRYIGCKFKQIRWKEFEIFGSLNHYIKIRTLGGLMDQLDEHLLKFFPSLRRYCRYVVIEYIK